MFPRRRRAEQTAGLGHSSSSRTNEYGGDCFAPVFRWRRRVRNERGRHERYLSERGPENACPARKVIARRKPLSGNRRSMLSSVMTETCGSMTSANNTAAGPLITDWVARRTVLYPCEIRITTSHSRDTQMEPTILLERRKPDFDLLAPPVNMLSNCDVEQLRQGLRARPVRPPTRAQHLPAQHVPA